MPKAAVCREIGSPLEIVDVDLQAPKAGEVREGVTNLEPGDHVVISWVPQCGECYFCKHGQGELCEPGSAAAMSGGLLDMTSRFSVGGQPLFQMAASGTFSEETVIPAIGAVKIPDDM